MKTLYAVIEGSRITKDKVSGQLRVFTTETEAARAMSSLVYSPSSSVGYNTHSVATITADFKIKKVVTTEVPLEVY